MEVNSGGCVLFCLFPPASPDTSAASPPAGKGPMGCLVIKFHPSRLAAQSEQFANELTRHLGVHAPACRILRSQVRPCTATYILPYRGACMASLQAVILQVQSNLPGNPMQSGWFL